MLVKGMLPTFESLGPDGGEEDDVAAGETSGEQGGGQMGRETVVER